MPPDDDLWNSTRWNPGDRVRHPRGSVHVLGERFSEGWYLRDEVLTNGGEVITPMLYDFVAVSYGWERVDE